ncbi:uncharacterized protein VP01_8829g1, partial [Puccinia sorghi]
LDGKLWRVVRIRVNGRKYKPAARKVRPRIVPVPQELNLPLKPIQWGQDPFKTLLCPHVSLMTVARLSLT